MTKQYTLPDQEPAAERKTLTAEQALKAWTEHKTIQIKNPISTYKIDAGAGCWPGDYTDCLLHFDLAERKGWPMWVEESKTDE